MVVRKIAELLRAAAEVMVDGELEHGLDLLADARSTDALIRELQAAADEGMAVVASSPFRVRHRGRPAADGRSWSTRWTGRCAAPGCWSGRPRWRPTTGGRCRSRTPCSRSTSLSRPTRSPTSSAPTGWRPRPRPALLAVGEATGRVERADVLAAEAILAQLRSVVVDLLLLTGMDQIESTDALPPPR